LCDRPWCVHRGTTEEFDLFSNTKKKKKTLTEGNTIGREGEKESSGKGNQGSGFWTCTLSLGGKGLGEKKSRNKKWEGLNGTRQAWENLRDSKKCQEEKMTLCRRPSRGGKIAKPRQLKGEVAPRKKYENEVSNNSGRQYRAIHRAGVSRSLY